MEHRENLLLIELRPQLQLLQLLTIRRRRRRGTRALRRGVSGVALGRRGIARAFLRAGAGFPERTLEGTARNYTLATPPTFEALSFLTSGIVASCGQARSHASHQTV